MKKQKNIILSRTKISLSLLMIIAVTLFLFICCVGNRVFGESSTSIRNLASSSSRQPEDFQLFKLLRESHNVVCRSKSQPNYVTVVPVPEHVPGGPTQDPIIKFNEGCVLVDVSDYKPGGTSDDISFLTFNYNNNEWDLWDYNGSSWNPILIPVPSSVTLYDGHNVILSRYGSKVIIPTPNSIIVLKHDPMFGKVVLYDTVPVVPGATIDPTWTNTNNGKTIIYSLVGDEDKEYQKVISDDNQRMVKDNMLYDWIGNGWDAGHQLSYAPTPFSKRYVIDEDVVCVDSNLRKTVAISNFGTYDFCTNALANINESGGIISYSNGDNYKHGSDTWLIDTAGNTVKFSYNADYICPYTPFNVWPRGYGLPPWWPHYSDGGQATVTMHNYVVSNVMSSNHIDSGNQIFHVSNRTHLDKRVASINRYLNTGSLHYTSYQQGDEVTLKYNLSD